MILSARQLLTYAALAACVWLSAGVRAEVYLSQAEFTQRYFSEAPEAGQLWLTDELKQQAKILLGRQPAGLRVRYQRSADGLRSAWIMNEIGKELPITIGVVVEGERIVAVEILAFRESRGWEVRFPAYTAQYRGAELDGEQLSQNIDGITGATLSVRAVNAVAKLALFYAQQLAPS
jgi:uncharacterized protein with FMN-binding domain